MVRALAPFEDRIGTVVSGSAMAPPLTAAPANSWMLAITSGRCFQALALSQRRFGFLGRRHSAIPNHPLRQTDSGLSVRILCVYMVTVGQAVAGRILDAPSPP